MAKKTKIEPLPQLVQAAMALDTQSTEVLNLAFVLPSGSPVHSAAMVATAALMTLSRELIKFQTEQDHGNIPPSAPPS